MAIVIAEFCQNHNGSPEILKEMIYAAADAGADYAKIQSIFVEDLTYRPEFEEATYDQEGRQLTFKRPYRTEYERLKALELDYKLHLFFIGECRRAGIRPLTTIFTRKRANDLAKLGFKAIKVASYDCASFPLIEDLKDKFSPIFISTGASSQKEIKHTASLLKSKDFYFLHCVTVYPTPLESLNIQKIRYLKGICPKAGFSDHTLAEKDGLKASLIALALGADVIERHFTILARDKTKDGPISIGACQLRQLCSYAAMEPAGLLNLAKASIPEWEEITSGQPYLELSADELLNRGYYRGRFAGKSAGGYIFNWEESGGSDCRSGSLRGNQEVY